MDIKKQLEKDIRNSTKYQKLFDEICNKKNWKEEVVGIIDSDKYDDYNSAVIYFTGGGIDIVKKLPNGKIKVHGYGYYFHIGA